MLFNSLINKFQLLLSQKNTLVKFISGSLFNSIAQIVSNILILKIISPQDLGTWNSLILIQTYALFLQAGVLNGLSRELPFYLGRNNLGKAQELAASSLYFFNIGILICILFGSVLGYFFFKNSSVEVIYTYAAIIAITAAKFYEGYLTTTFRSNNSFERLSWIYFIRGILLFITLILVFFFSYTGYIIRMVVISFITILLMHKVRPIKVKPKFNLSALIQLIKVGIPIFLLVYIYNSSLTFDRIMLIKYSTVNVIGYYSLGLMALSAYKMLPESLANYIYPRLSFSLGEGTSKFILISKSLKANFITFLLMLILSLIGVLILPPIIKEFFPKYIEGIRSAQILLFAGAFAGGTIGNNLITSLKSWKYLTLIFIVGALLNIICIYLFSIYSSNILLGISWGMVISSFLFFILSNITLVKMRNDEAVII
jgi:O-antigen/teichoic acid export membrane protein